MCPREIYDFPEDNIKLEHFRRVIDQGKEFLEFVVPYGIGEPMLHPKLYDMITYCKENGLKTGISTNATLLNEARSRKLIESGLDYLIFAFDGTTPEVYEKYRKGANFHQVRQNILNFLKLKKEMGSSIFCILQMVKLKENQHQIRDFYKMWSIDGVDAIRIKTDEVETESTTIAPRPAPTPAGQVRRNPCHIIWKGPMYVRFDGKVFPCCYAYATEPIGDIQENSIAEIWNSERMLKLREAHVRGDLSGYAACLNCKAVKPRWPLIVGSFVVDMYKVRKLIPFFEKLFARYKVSIFEG
jgi:radical SAM protein with 4Fe4S-binding SPASM domain